MVAAGLAATHFAHGLACALGDPDAGERTYCDGLWAVPALGAIATFAGVLATMSTSRWWPLLAGAATGALTALLPWVLLGDPSGNFGGLLE